MCLAILTFLHIFSTFFHLFYTIFFQTFFEICFCHFFPHNFSSSIPNQHLLFPKQYQKHDVSDWLDENATASQLLGFKWRGGRMHETVGILMWSEIFTHDFENGEKVALILLDTQGLYDRHSSMQDYTTIFALSMMLSSVQCYNLMNNIQEDDLQHLQLFTEYGRLAMEQTNEKPFQYLLFIVRDWSYANEIGYGWHGQEIIEEIFNDNSSHTLDMRRLRERINSSFQEIGAFLLPHPGFAVARQRNFNGNLHEIEPEFVEYVKQLVPALMAPENLVVKQINGRKVRAKDFVLYLQAYLRNFNENTLPQPKSLWTVRKCFEMKKFIIIITI